VAFARGDAELFPEAAPGEADAAGLVLVDHAILSWDF
jgi:hypothetical protein